ENNIAQLYFSKEIDSKNSVKSEYTNLCLSKKRRDNIYDDSNESLSQNLARLCQKVQDNLGQSMRDFVLLSIRKEYNGRVDCIKSKGQTTDTR
ncbi:9247_t:CDS:1, partial [Acaulospora colombiana]